MEPIDNIPGLTFRLVAVAQLPPPIEHPEIECVARGEVRLSAEIHDFELWSKVLEQLKELRIYTVKDLKTQMIAVSQKKAKEAFIELEEHKNRANSEIESLKQKLSFAEAENKILREANHQWSLFSRRAELGEDHIFDKEG